LLICYYLVITPSEEKLTMIQLIKILKELHNWTKRLYYLDMDVTVLNYSKAYFKKIPN
jgi:hypothetical protein